ncbi:MAG: serine/threonine protein kinase/pSer/pThr/pTyr-binding forkhead associated (FHA) protein [Planctomycetota bacterium]|jgi:serine/threonine protein kinase/pSer/pThr/pTyr-binding forkhead associated (FHA) protein
MNGDSNNSGSTEAVLKVRINGQNRRFVLVADELVTIGRASTCGIHLDDKSVSREHCVAVFTKGKIVINDLRSTHGVTKDGEKVGHCELQPGDTCHLGNAFAMFEPGGAQSQAKVVSATTRTPAAKASATPAASKPAAPVDAIEATATNLAPVASGTTASQAGSSAPASDSNEEASGSTEPARAIAGYRIIDTLGQGGYGTVYRAEQVQLHREVALKVLKHGDDSSDHKAQIEAFLREARLAAGLRDPRLVQIYDVGESDGEHFLSMELIEGGSLARKIRRDGPVPWQDVIRQVRDIALALKVAHAAQLVHRDVKPGNILLAANGQAKLTDLGLAASGEHAGTIAFMSPEQLRRENIDARADIYALGCTAYAALTGSPPFAGDRQEMARGHLKQKPTPLLDRDVQVPYHLGQLIVESMMAKDPNDRPQSAAAVIERLDRMILPSNSEPIGLDEDEFDYPSVAPTRLGRPARGGGSSKTQKAFMARLSADAIIFTIVGATVIALLLGLKVVCDLDIYRIIGR